MSNNSFNNDDNLLVILFNILCMVFIWILGIHLVAAFLPYSIAIGAFILVGIAIYYLILGVIKYLQDPIKAANQKAYPKAYQKALEKYRLDINNPTSYQHVLDMGKKYGLDVEDVYRDCGEIQYNVTFQLLTMTDTPQLRNDLRVYGQWLIANYSRKYSSQSIANDLTILFSGRSSKPQNVAQQIEQLSRLFSQGAISQEEFTRGKALFLGNPPDVATKTIEILDNLYRLQQRGALSESEYNFKKWDLLSGNNLSGRK